MVAPLDRISGLDRSMWVRKDPHMSKEFVDEMFPKSPLV